VAEVGVDTVWLALCSYLMTAGLLLPPGCCFMTMKGVAPREVTMAHIFRAGDFPISR